MRWSLAHPSAVEARLQVSESESMAADAGASQKHIVVLKGENATARDLDPGASISAHSLG